jgi:hypothetical protein
VVFIMVDFHRARIDMRLQGIEGVRQRRHAERAAGRWRTLTVEALDRQRRGTDCSEESGLF